MSHCTNPTPHLQIKSILNSPAVNKTFCGFQNLTDPRQRTKDIMVEKTKTFDSSMRPMLLKFTNQVSIFSILSSTFLFFHER